MPVLITSAKRSDAERIAGLRAGADDYLAKPFNPHELTAAVAAILRRARGTGTPDLPPILSLAGGRLVLDPGSRRYTLADGSHGRLTPGESSLVVVLAAHPGQVLGRQRLLGAVARRPDEVYERVVDVHVANLRASSATTLAIPGSSRPSGRRLSARRERRPAAMMRGRSLAVRLALLLAGVLVVVLLLAGVVVNRAASRSLDRHPRSAGAGEARARRSLRRGEPATWRGTGASGAIVRRIARESGGVVRIVDDSGAPIAEGGPAPDAETESVTTDLAADVGAVP